MRNPIIETVSQIQKEHSKKNIPKNIEQENLKEEFPFIQKKEIKTDNLNENGKKENTSLENMEIEENNDNDKNN